VRVAGARLALIEGDRHVSGLPSDQLAFQAECAEAFVASWTILRADGHDYSETAGDYSETVHLNLMS
jgi:hypothetical protein